MQKIARLVITVLSLALCTSEARALDLPYCPLLPVDPSKPAPPPYVPPPVLPLEPSQPPPAPMRAQPTLATYHRGSIWSRIGNTERWTAAALAVVQARRIDFEQARDVETFCPGYARANQAQRDICWLRIIGAVVELESSFKYNGRPFCEGNGVYSVGLMALSTGECPNAMTIPELMNPEANLICGINRMAKLIARDHYVEGEKKGASAYWSVLRTPYRFLHQNGRWYTLGKRDKVLLRTKLFNRY